jgi:hypothetical protein
MTVTVHCSCQKESIDEVHLSDEVPASAMDELG